MTFRLAVVSGLAVAVLALAAPRIASAQGVTTSGISGIVRDTQNLVVPGVSIDAVHEPSGTTYSAVTQTDGRFVIPGMRVGGPYNVTAQLSGFRTEIKHNITLTLGVTQDLEFTLSVATVAETVNVVSQTSPIFSSSRTGAATAVSRERARDAADDLGPHQRPDAPHAAVPAARAPSRGRTTA